MIHNSIGKKHESGQDSQRGLGGTTVGGGTALGGDSMGNYNFKSSK